MSADPYLVDTTEDLDDLVDAYLGDLDRGTAGEEYRPLIQAGPREASRALERVRAIDAEVAALDLLYRQRSDDLTDWRNRASERLDRRRAWYVERLAEFAIPQLPPGKSRHTVSLPEGELVVKKPGPEYKVDHVELGRHLLDLGLSEYVERHLVVAAAWSDVKKLTTTAVAGELGVPQPVTLGGIPLRGVTATPRPITVDVKPGSGR